ncbi:MAG: putative DNA modification/repair radical SAM protein [Lachnospiraceae bacterium]|nr:putative DNA modification/repair radical SAM protein [Lachnospiraceae bacterium]
MALSQEIFEKLKILTDAAKYDVACTSSGSSRRGVKGTMGNTVAGGICHCFSADGRCISLLKILLTNECVFDCKYCCNRLSQDTERATFTPEEVAELTISFYRRNYIEGLFLSSGIKKNPDYTMEQIYQAVYLLRTKYKFNGYIHVKAIPGADPVLIEKTGWIVDRMSVNLELPTADGLKNLAPQKNRRKILTPMKQIQMGRKESLLLTGHEMSRDTYAGTALMEKSAWSKESGLVAQSGTRLPQMREDGNYSLQEFHPGSSFVPAGQSTQMIVGASGESDYEIVHVAEALYRQFDLKRVFYSAFINTTQDTRLPDTSEKGPQLLREHRLYQADFLMRYYQFRAEEIITEENPNLNVQIDPKCNWALNHLEQFPVEVQTADYHTLLRIPGVGVKSARRIMAARRMSSLDYASLKKFGVVLKRAMYFITCNGKMMMPIRLNKEFILTNLLGLGEKLPAHTTGSAYRQMSLFDLGEAETAGIGMKQMGGDIG